MIHIKQFYGLSPKIKNKKNGMYANECIDVNLSHGTLKPYKKPLFIKQFKDDTKQWVKDCDDYVEFDKSVQYIWYKENACKSLIVAGLKDYLVRGKIKNGVYEYHRLGVPSPNNRLFAMESGGDFTNEYMSYQKNREQVSYIYTYVNEQGEEGVASVPSNIVDISKGSKVTLSGFTRPDASYTDIKKIRIYRLGTGDSLSGYFFVDEINIGQLVYVDNKKFEDLGVIYDENNSNNIIDNPCGIEALPDENQFLFWKKNKLYFSGQNEPFKFYDNLTVTVDDDIETVKAMNDYIYVFTKYHYYVLQESKSNIEFRNVIKSKEPYNILNKEAVVSEKGVFFLTKDGIYNVSGATVKNITANYFTADKWKEMQPETFRLCYFKDGLIFSGLSGTYFMRFEETIQQSILTQLSFYGIMMKYEKNGELYYKQGNLLYRFNSDSEDLEYLWESDLIELPYKSMCNCGRIQLNGKVNFELRNDVRQIMNRDFLTNKVDTFNLKRHNHQLFYRLVFKGSGEVSEIHLAQEKRGLSSD